MKTPSKKTLRTSRRSRAPAVTAMACEIIHGLRQRRDPKRACGVQQYFRHEIAALGIDTPTLREFASRQSKRLAPVWSLPEAVALCGRLLEEAELEVRGVGILILSAFRREFRPGLTRVARRWLETRLDNWALVDSLCDRAFSRGGTAPVARVHPADRISGQSSPRAIPAKPR